MEPIFDSNGKTIGWLEDDVIYDRRNYCRAFLSDGAIFKYNGYYIGRLNNGFFRDKSGNAVAFIEGAHSGPLTPITEIPPIPPIPAIPPIPPIPHIPPIPPIDSLGWSIINWEEFLG